MDKNSTFYNAAVKPTRIVITFYAVAKQFFITYFDYPYAPEHIWLYRLIISVIMVSVIFAATGSKRLTKKQVTYVVLFTATLSELAFFVVFNGDRLIFSLLVGCTLLGLMYGDVKAILVVMCVSGVILAFCLFGLGIEVAHEHQSDKIFDFSGAAILIITSILLGKHTIGSLDRARMEAEVATRAKSDFLAAVSHEIRTPMNAILGIAQIRLQSGTLRRGDEEAYGRIYSSGGCLLGIINDILDLSKIESGKLELLSDEYDVPSLINDALQISMVRVGSKPVELALDVDETLPSKLLGDELRLKQILNNLLSNAIKYTEKGRVELSVSHSERGGGVALRFTVKDTGQGMTPENMSELFTEYSRFNAAANRTVEGTGLGLSITKKLTEMMGGGIEARSVYGEGSVFTVTVTQKAAGAGPIGSELAEKLRGFTFEGNGLALKRRIIREIMPGATVLIVDDVASNLYVAEGLLSPYGMVMETATSGAEAVKKAASRQYDVIFMDHMMPGMDGVEATEKLRGLGYAGTIVALTANAVSGSREMFLRRGFNDYLSKPIDTDRLDEVLRTWIPKEKRAAVDRSGDENRGRSRSPVLGVTEIIGGDSDADTVKNIVIEGIDVILGVTRTGGTVDGYLSTLEIFRDDGSMKAGEIREALAAADLPLYTTYIHALKSASANVGAAKLSEAARKLEEAGRRGNKAFIDEHTDSLLTELESLLADVDRALSAIKKDRGRPDGANANALDPVLTELKSAIDAIDPSAINSAVKRLECLEHAAAADIRARIKTIRRHVLNGEYDEAVEAMGALR